MWTCDESVPSQFQYKKASECIKLVLIYRFFKNSLKIYTENTKENHNHVASLNVIKMRLLSFSNYCGLRNINFQTFFAKSRVKGFL